MSIKLSIILVNWNSVDYLRLCLASIAAHPPLVPMEVIVVDNASYDGSEAMIQEDFPSFRYVQSKENLGFARANNLGVSYASGHALLFLNPDTEVKAGALQSLYEGLFADEGVGASGARLLNSDGTLQTTCLQAFPTILNQFLDAEYLKRAFPRWRLWGMRPLYCGEAFSDEVEMISGACIMVRRTLFDRIGGFSSEYFMYGEDADFCYRILRAGYRLRYIAGAEVVHYGGQSSKQRSESGFGAMMTREAIYKFLRKTRGPLYASLCRLALMSSALIRLAMLGAASLLIRNEERRRAYLAMANKWRLMLRWTAGLEPWTRVPNAGAAATEAKPQKSSIAASR